MDDLYDSADKTFRTQNGTCTVTPSQILITRLDKQGKDIGGQQVSTDDRKI